MNSTTLDFMQNNAGWLSSIATIIFSAIATFLAIRTYQKASERFFPKTKPERFGYHAIFLTNGQTYFGKIVEFDHEYIKLKNIYYLEDDKNPHAINSKQLVKLGNELHGPDDAMYINRSQVLFWEDIKEHGRVLQAIKEYEKNTDKSQ